MATKYISPGIYEVNGVRVNGKTAKDAESAFTQKTGKSANSSVAAKQVSTTKNGQVVGQQLPTVNNINYKDPNSVETGARQEGNYSQVKSILGQNANQQTDFGSSTTTVDPTTGQATVTTGLSGANKELYNADTQAGIAGRNLAGTYLSSAPHDPYNANNVGPQYAIPTAGGADRSRIEDATYSSLTRGLEDQAGKDIEAKKQELYNRGIPIGSQAYESEMKGLNDRYDTQRLQARAQATQQGLQEQNSYVNNGLNINKQAVGNLQSNYSLPASLANTVAGIGAGPQGTGTTPYQGAAQTPVNTTAIAAVDSDTRTKNAQIASQNSIAAKRLAASGGGGSSTDNTPTVVG